VLLGSTFSSQLRHLTDAATHHNFLPRNAVATNQELLKKRTWPDDLTYDSTNQLFYIDRRLVYFTRSTVERGAPSEVVYQGRPILRSDVPLTANWYSTLYQDWDVVDQHKEQINQNRWNTITLVDINHSINEGTIKWASIDNSLYDSSNDFCYVTEENGNNWILTKDKEGCHLIHPPELVHN